MGRVTVYSGPERRRRWSEAEWLAILGKAFSPGACVAEVCLRHGISAALVYTWRRKVRDTHAEPVPTGLVPAFAEAMVVADDRPSRSEPCPAIVVDLGRGRRISIFATASTGQVVAALKALR